MTVDQPLRRRRRRRAHHHLQGRRAEHVDGAVEPAPIVFTRRWFHPAPGKLSNPHLLDTERFHAAGVVFPHRFRPMFRVIADSKAHPSVLYA
jgi:hypothetical protein